MWSKRRYIIDFSKDFWNRKSSQEFSAISFELLVLEEPLNVTRHAYKDRNWACSPYTHAWITFRGESWYTNRWHNFFESRLSNISKGSTMRKSSFVLLPTLPLFISDWLIKHRGQFGFEFDLWQIVTWRNCHLKHMIILDHIAVIDRDLQRCFKSAHPMCWSGGSSAFRCLWISVCARLYVSGGITIG